MNPLDRQPIDDWEQLAAEEYAKSNPAPAMQTITTLHHYCATHGYTEEASKLEGYKQTRTRIELERARFRAEHGDAALAARDWMESQREREAFFEEPEPSGYRAGPGI